MQRDAKGKYMRVWAKREAGAVIGRRIRERMKARGLSIDALSERAGVERKNVWKWVNGLSMPRWYHMKLLAEILGCTVDWLITGEDEPDTVVTDEMLGEVG